MIDDREEAIRYIFEKHYINEEKFLETIDDIITFFDEYTAEGDRSIRLCSNTESYYNDLRRPCATFGNGTRDNELCVGCFLLFKPENYYDFLKGICKLCSSSHLPSVHKILIAGEILGRIQPYMEHDRIRNLMGEPSNSRELEYHLLELESWDVNLKKAYFKKQDDFMSPEKIGFRNAVLNKIIEVANREIEKIDNQKNLTKN